MYGAERHPLPLLVDEVLRTHGRLLAATADLAADEGLTGPQSLVLTAVVRAGRPPTVPQIGRSLGRARQSIQRLVDILVEQGLVASKENPDHKRASLLIATEDGRAVYDRMNRRSQPWVARVTDGIDEDDLIAATRTLRALRERLQQDVAQH